MGVPPETPVAVLDVHAPDVDDAVVDDGRLPVVADGDVEKTVPADTALLEGQDPDAAVAHFFVKRGRGREIGACLQQHPHVGALPGLADEGIPHLVPDGIGHETVEFKADRPAGIADVPDEVGKKVAAPAVQFQPVAADGEVEGIGTGEKTGEGTPLGGDMAENGSVRALGEGASGYEQRQQQKRQSRS